MCIHRRQGSLLREVNLERVRSAGSVVVLRGADKHLAKAVKPGQFVMMRGWDRYDPLLPRPFSVMDVQGEWVYFLVKGVGPGSTMLQRGGKVYISEPLGNGFTVDEKSRVVVVGGGSGIAGVFLLTRVLPKGNLYWGVRQEDYVHLEFPNEWKVEVVIEEQEGLVTERVSKGDILYACGPEPMLRKLAQKRDMWGRVEFLIERRMACGVGVCRGCVVEGRGGYLTVCKDGPVFSLEELGW